MQRNSDAAGRSTSLSEASDWPSLAESREEMRRSGVLRLPTLLGPSTTKKLLTEARALEARAHWSHSHLTPYLGQAGPHSAAFELVTTVGALAYDEIPATSDLRRLYDDSSLRGHLADAVGLPCLYPYADPLGAINYAYMNEGHRIGWHFDTTEFVLIILLQSSSGGGELKAFPVDRTGDEREQAEVAELVRSGETGAGTVPLAPGDGVFMSGRQVLHCVSPVQGGVQRVVAILSFDSDPGADSSAFVKLARYGRTGPVEVSRSEHH